MSVVIEKLDGTKYDLKQFGLVPSTFTIDSPSPRHVSEIVEGRSGYLDLGTTFEGRTMKATFYIKGKDKYDYLLLRDEVFRLFDARTFFYLIDKNQPKKRWKVKTAAPYTPERFNGRIGTLEIQFVSPSPYAESYGTTIDPFTFTDELWQVGQGVISEDLKYAHSVSFFRIYNGSDIDIDPREIPLLIKYQGISNNLKIKNITSGDEWAFTGASGVNDTILLDGVRSLKNSLTIFGQTNRKLIKLKKGWNDFQLSGASGSFLISFDFRFHTI
ncbi:phage tail family protein [Sporosarcina sp. ANT_H38]|uniref:phage tail family protein n=1 Tax=Sporosarcina sp. ANT_H38 TaxID=2597358 RepID=UPI0011F2B141|nr:phage tail family protein [Sporosarcina sp. ANT_H38]KAA0944150.1 phage tail family protein [Sporosarcina sp. ANT_H38]